jgi:predicted O-methyltransferase YrrM
MKQDVKQIVEQAMSVRPLTGIAERECVAKYAQQVRQDGIILEVGCLYGGMTAVLGLANPGARIYTIDDFSWHPEDDVPTSPALLYSNMAKVGVKNVTVIEGDSRLLGLDWMEPIDMLWIDGGHSYDYVFADLMNFGRVAKTIALHDYGNPFWASIKQAVDDYIRLTVGQFEIIEVSETVVVLQRL